MSIPRASAAPHGGDAGKVVREPVEPHPTVWARAGARPWALCREKAAEAASLQPKPIPYEKLPKDHRWLWLAKACPHTIEIISFAARTELMRIRKLQTGANLMTDIDAIEAHAHQRRTRALELLDHAAAESARRNEPPPPSLEHWRGKALLAEGRYAEADRAFARGEEGAGLLPARVRRMRAVTALFQGDLKRALQLSYRAWLDSAGGDARLLSSYVYALVLERSGDRIRARRMMRHAMDNDRDRIVAGALLGVFPLHEHLYFLALEAQTLGDLPQAQRLWRAYLTRVQPEEPERRLVEHHLEEIKRLSNGRRGGSRSG